LSFCLYNIHASEELYVQAKLSCGSGFPWEEKNCNLWDEEAPRSWRREVPITLDNALAHKSHKKYAMKLQRLIIFISFLVTKNYIGDMKSCS
jgi:hypothetical protein